MKSSTRSTNPPTLRRRSRSSTPSKSVKKVSTADKSTSDTLRSKLSYNSLLWLLEKADNKEGKTIPKDEGGLSHHPLIVDARITLTRRIWSDWKGGLSASFITAVVLLYLPEQYMDNYVLPLRFELVRLMVLITCFGVMFTANWTEHVLQPPVEPAGIVSFGGKSVFFTVNVIGILLAYYTISLVGQFLRVFGHEVEVRGWGGRGRRG